MARRNNSSEQDCFKTAAILWFRSKICLVMSLLCLTGIVFGQEDPTAYFEMSLEQLLDVEVTSVAKKQQQWFSSAAAVHLITGDDIRRSGVTSIPEALRMVPGVQVARIDANKWAISSRGFNERFANKLLVLIDGRSVYSPLFSGVYWEVQDLLLEDIDRIEVIRGPGGAVWGANAVNGVINIITRKSVETAGLYVSVGAGTEERGFGSLRYGGQLHRNITCRLYGKYFNRDSYENAAGLSTNDQWQMLRGGFRLDWDAGGSDLIMLQGDLYDGDVNQIYTFGVLEPPYQYVTPARTITRGSNVLGRWQHRFSERSDMSVQLYFDTSKRFEGEIADEQHAYDLEFQHRLPFGSRQDVIWGFGYRRISDSQHYNGLYILRPQDRTVRLLSFFAQDEIALVRDRLNLIIGAKLEDNYYTGLELQPSVRLALYPQENQMLWAAVSKAVRTPSRAEDHARVNALVIPPGLDPSLGPYPGLVVMQGSKHFASEDLLACELGFRIQPKKHIYFDLAGFYNSYMNLRTVEPGQVYFEAAPAPHLVIPYGVANRMSGNTHGLEIASEWRVLNRWKLKAAYAYLNIALALDTYSQDPYSEGAEYQSPAHQLSLQSQLNPLEELEMDFWFRYVDELQDIAVQHYFDLDIRIGLKLIKSVDLDLVAQNLLKKRHSEFTSVSYINSQASEVQRGFYTRLIFRL
jgi:iron complex outermembrane receptor protein